LFPRAYRVIVTAPKQARALRPEAVRDLSGGQNIEVAEDLGAALALADAAPEDAIFITGSLFLVGEARTAFISC